MRIENKLYIAKLYLPLVSVYYVVFENSLQGIPPCPP
jgi:hypothetical protein